MKPLQPRTVDDYLATLSEDKRAALERLRRTIASVAPDAEECIRYGVPTFLREGEMLVALGAGAKCCSFYAGAHPIRVHRDELTPYDLGVGTIRFQPGRALPDELVRKLVETRVAQRTAGR